MRSQIPNISLWSVVREYKAFHDIDHILHPTPPTPRLPYLAYHDYTELSPHAAQSSSQVGETDGAVIFEACVGES